MSVCHMQHFIALQGSQDQSRAQAFIKYIRQQSPAPLLESALVRRRSSAKATVIAERDGSVYTARSYPWEAACSSG